MADRQTLKSSSFKDLNPRSWRGQGGDTEDQFLAEDDDALDQVAAHVDLSEADIDKAISTGLGPEREDDPDTDDEGTKGAKAKLKTDDDRAPLDGDREDERYSKKTRKRIERERRVTARERQQRIEAERERDELRTRLEAIENRQATQDKAQLDGEVQGFTTQLTDLETRLAKASEDGEHAEVAKLTRQMQETAASRAEAQRRRDASQARQANGKGDDKTNRQGQPPAKPMDRRAQELLDANGDWWDDDAHFEDRQVILAIDAAVAKDGFKSNTDEYYVEMVRRARAKGLGDLVQLPEFISEDDVKSEDDDEDAITDDPRSINYRKKPRRQPQRRGPGGLGDGGRGRGVDAQLRREASGKVVLTQRDIQRMQQFRLDPDNKEHVRQWARSKQEAARQELQSRE